ncbi:hypothetical protein HA402_001942 [Bradysia odoriphaga]|nr:hypothetical protein HA402_001942 [Bradysia odoriphaga]
MKSVVLLLLAAIQLSAAYSYSSYNSYSRPREVFTYAPNFQAALQQSQAEGKPILVIVHLTNCRACKDLFNDLPKSQEIQNLAKRYVVVHSLDGSDKQLENLGPRSDRYFPRCFIFGRNGQLIPIRNSRQPKYPFYYSTASELAKSLNDGLASGQY